MFPYWCVYFTKVFYLSFSINFQNIVPSSKDFMLQNLILRTRLCSTGFISQHCWVVDFHLINMIRRKCFAPDIYQLWQGKSAGLALIYFYMIHMIHRVGRPVKESSYDDNTFWFGLVNYLTNDGRGYYCHYHYYDNTNIMSYSCGEVVFCQRCLFLKSWVSI